MNRVVRELERRNLSAMAAAAEMGMSRQRMSEILSALGGLRDGSREKLELWLEKSASQP